MQTPTYRRPEYWGYDTGRRTVGVDCCGKTLTDQVAYEQHMKAKHSKQFRKLKKSGYLQQMRLDGWTSFRKRR